MKISNFKKYTGKNGISIARRSPKDYDGPVYLPLNPDSQTLILKKSGKIDEKEYIKRYYNNTLSKLNAQEVYDTLKDKVLLCWEPDGDFCHRYIVAEWIKKELGVEVKEWQYSDDRDKSKNKNLF